MQKRIFRLVALGAIAGVWLLAEATGRGAYVRGSEGVVERLTRFAGVDHDGAAAGTDRGKRGATTGLWKPTHTYTPHVDDFIRDVEATVYGGAAARRAAAARHGFSVAQADDALRLLRDMEADRYEAGRIPVLRRRALELLSSSRRAPVALALAALIHDELSDTSCSTADVDALMSGSRDVERDLWIVAASCTSSAIFAEALDRGLRSRPALLYLSMDWTGADAASELAAADILLTPEFLLQVDAGERDFVHADVARFKIATLMDVGLLDDAVAVSDGLPLAVRKLMLSPNGGQIRTRIGGFELKSSPYGVPVAADLAAALALAGRPHDGHSVLDTAVQRAKRSRARACLDRGARECGNGGDRFPLEVLVAGQLLDDPRGDPYVLFEAAAADFSSFSGGVTEALCRLSSQPTDQSDCQAARRLIAANRAKQIGQDAGDRSFWAAIRRAGGQPYEAARTGYAARIATLGVLRESATDRSRASVEPAPVPFREWPLARATAGRVPRRADSPAFAALPMGFTLVRAERSEGRAAAVSLSQRFDPNGEVTAGGYWLHLSSDGGKSWEPPLYTGLAEHFPYVVPERSRLPMLVGDRLQLEVEEALIDTASITYPPVGTRVKRKRRGIYLDIPIEALRADRDGDGFSDIAARHLLLDQPGISATPFVVGRDSNCSPRSSEIPIRVELLKRLLGVEARAIIPGVGQGAQLFGTGRRSEPTVMPPIFVRGDPVDYRCVTVDRPMIVYSTVDQAQLRKFSPDFQLIDLPAVRWNRTRSRGYVKWTTGWAGGTYRISRDGSRWTIESISEWIS